MALIRRDRQKGIKDFSMAAIVEEYRNRMNLNRSDCERYYRKAMDLMCSDDGRKFAIYVDKAIEACKFLISTLWTKPKEQNIEHDLRNWRRLNRKRIDNYIIYKRRYIK